MNRRFCGSKYRKCLIGLYVVVHPALDEQVPDDETRRIRREEGLRWGSRRRAGDCRIQLSQLVREEEEEEEVSINRCNKRSEREERQKEEDEGKAPWKRNHIFWEDIVEVARVDLSFWSYFSLSDIVLSLLLHPSTKAPLKKQSRDSSVGSNNNFWEFQN